jgi:Na+/proline symporter
MTYVQFDGPRDLLNQVYNYNPDLFSIEGAKGAFSIGAIVSGAILFGSVPITQPQFLTRYLLIEKKNGEKYLRSIAFGMGALLAIGTFAILPVGLGGAVKFPNLTNGDMLVGEFLHNSLPAWFGGVFTVGVLAAAMSTADSILFSLGQMFSRDIFRGIIAPKSSENLELIVGKVFIFSIASIAFIFGILNSDLIVNLSSLSYAGTLQLLPTVIGGLWLPKAWKHASTLSILVGMISLFVFLNYNPFAFINLHPGIPSLILGSFAFFLSDRIMRKK